MGTQLITQILAAVFLLGICIFVHELGHFLVGKWVGIKAKIFSIGYGRGIWFKKKDRTIYQITAFPIGGYVQFYGDDPSKEHKKLKKGDFFAAGPWHRIAAAFGGPGFSIIFGFVVIFVLVSSGWQPISNKIDVVNSEIETPAKKAGLQSEDKIVEINGITVESFEEINYHIALAEDSNLRLKIERNGQILEKTVRAEAFEPGEPLRIGIKPWGKNYLSVLKGKSFTNGNLVEEDKIVAVNDKNISSITELRNILSDNIEKYVNITVLRNKGTVFKPEAEEKVNITVPVQKYEYLLLENIYDVQTEKVVPEIEIGELNDAQFSKIYINGKSYSNWSDFKKSIESNINEKNNISLSIGAVLVNSKVTFQKRGLLGISLTEFLTPEKANLPTDFISIIKRTYSQTIFTTKSTLVGLYRIFQGKLSFNKSVSGPVKIITIAAESVSAGWDTYWFLLANITIILGIMNLLPIPVLDGGHIVFYFIEAIYKPIPPDTVAKIMRVGMAILITFGMYVIGLDLWDVLIKRFF
ncbi:MAG: site-2 protease family protein [Spirochaetia bacterium]|nr:site-2 protease family protein [Spirochaetia bacterium]